MIRFERFFQPPVVARMKCQNRHVSAGFQVGRQISQKCVERGKLVIHGDTQRLKNAADVQVAIFPGNVRQRVRGCKTFSCERRAD